MALDLFITGVPIGSVVRCRSGCFAYSPSGVPLGEYADLDAAAAALASRLALEAVAA